MYSSRESSPLVLRRMWQKSRELGAKGGRRISGVRMGGDGDTEARCLSLSSASHRFVQAGMGRIWRVSGVVVICV